MKNQIVMTRKRFGYFPRTFVWKGREYNVEVVECCWTTGSRCNGGQMQRHYFNVHCHEGRFEMYQNISDQTWHMTLVPPLV